jgi:hypothetical protein
MKASCTMLEVAGIDSALAGMRLPTKSSANGNIEKDIDLARRLIVKGNVHGKFQRGITAWLDINMPRFMWTEIDTYQVGVSPTSSESTMYTIFKEARLDYAEFKDMFVDGIDDDLIYAYHQFVMKVRNDVGLGRISRDAGIWKIKSTLPEGWMQRRIKSFSYQALKGVFQYRYYHRLPEWQIICDCIASLPYANELIFGMPVEQFIKEVCE